MKKFVSLTIAAVMALSLLAGCSGNDKASKTPETVQETSKEAAKEAPKETVKKPVELKVSFWGNDAHKKMFEGLFAKFKEKNPHITVELLNIPANDYQKKMSMFMAANSLPEIAWLADRMIPQFLYNNHLKEITTLKSDKDYDFSDIIPATLGPVTKDGKEYGVAFSTPPFILYYNKNLFKENNLKTPMELHKEGKWTFDEFVNSAKKISKPDKGIYGASFNKNNWKNYADGLAFQWGFGGNTFSDDGKKFLMNTPENEKALQLYADMMFKDRSHPKPGEQLTFETGKIGMYRDTLTYMSKAKAIKDFEWDIAPFPKGPVDGPVQIGYAAYCMFKAPADQKPESQELFKFLTGKDSMKVTAQFWVPSRKTVLESDEFKKVYPVSPETMKIVVLDQIAKGKVMAAPEKQIDVENEINLLMDLLYAQGISVKDMLKKMDEKVQPLMK